MIDNSNATSQHLFSSLLNILIYAVIFLLSNLFIVSFIAFFHFLLNHDFVTIELWITGSLWEIATCSSVLTGVLFYRFILLEKQFSSFFLDFKNFFTESKFLKSPQSYSKFFSVALGWIIICFIFLFWIQNLSYEEFKELLREARGFRLVKFYLFSLILFSVPMLLADKVWNSREVKDTRNKFFFNQLFSIGASILIFQSFNIISTTRSGAPLVLIAEFYLALFYLTYFKDFALCLFFLAFIILPTNILWGIHPFIVGLDANLVLLTRGDSILLFGSLLLTVILFIFRDYIQSRNVG